MRFPKPVRFLIALALLSPPEAFAQSATELMDSLRLLDPEVLPPAIADDPACEAAGRFWSMLVAVGREEAGNRQFRSSVDMSLEGNEASGPITVGDEEDEERRQLYKLNSRMNASYGRYPGQFKFRAGIGVTFEDGEFREDVSDLFVAYDRYARDWAEFFVFADRSSDNFLSIDQRYEVGAGVVVPIGRRSTHGWTKQGTEFLNETAYALPTSRARADSTSIHDALWVRCYLMAESLMRGEGIDSAARSEGAAVASSSERSSAASSSERSSAAAQADRQTVDREQGAPAGSGQETLDPAQVERFTALAMKADSARERARRSASKHLFKFRTALALGAFVEFEMATLEGSIRRDTVETTLEAPLRGERKIRLQIRPTLEWRASDAVSLGFHPYFKLPAPGGGWRVEVPDRDGGTREVVDIRYDIQSWLQVRLSSGSPSVRMWLEHRWLHDRAPPAAVLSEGTLIARDTRNSLKLGFGLEW